MSETHGTDVAGDAGEAACPQARVRSQHRRPQGDLATVEDGIAHQSGAARLVVERDVAWGMAGGLMPGRATQ
jgi:hypothetical protein